ncbi:type II secretion system protein N [Brevundimonas sp.]|uniref:type II secretion system protein N n=1 Tax=Brevundimonas sp. TaxID=1871086 RepID=UPI002731F39B|nr:type II secretion system protein N [Brevundimonas sp.]MDP1913762.1 type II secretion system protein N [Brevundimonas sp.]
MTAALLRSPVFWFRVVSLFVVASLALGVARLTWRLVGWDDGREAVWTPAALAPVGGATGGDLASILTWAPFGGGSANTGGLPISSLGLVLRGVVYAAGGGSTALISNGPGPVQIFTVGQAPVGNAVIEVIEVDRIILNVGGRREALILPHPAGEPAPGMPAGAAPAAMAPAVVAAPSSEAQAALASASPVATAAAAEAARRPPPPPQPVVTPSNVAGSLGVVPSAQGYVIGADSAPQLLRAGLRPGDVIKSLNGQALGNPASDQQIFQRAAAGGRARVEVVRDGRTLTLTVPLR